MHKVLGKDRFKSRGTVEKPVPTVSSTDKPQAPEIEMVIVDPSGTGKRYQRGKFLGKGGFAKCYELIDMDTQEVYAGKIVPKVLLAKPHQREKMTMEIAIHRSLSHSNIVGFHSFFEDDNFVYVILELCRRRSMMELHKRRKALTEPEVRYYMKQLLEACCFLHNKKIIHRDLKLGNLFLNDDMQVKIGDFGLATKLDYEGERKKTLCGTPNYIAPEVLSKKGHSFEVDVWSVGCILYTLLVGKPPFETSSLKETYMRIKKNEYYIPSRVSHPAQMLIIKMLRPDPAQRPRMQEVLDDAFFQSGYLPLKLHVSCLTMVPRFPSSSQLSTSSTSTVTRKPLLEINSRSDTRGAPLGNIPEGKKFEENNVSHAVCVKDGIGHDVPEEKEMETEGEPEDCYLAELHKQITSVLASRPIERKDSEMDDIEDPASTPIYWVSKWVDYSDKYGLGYQLNDGSVGVLFNDSTRLLMNEDGETLQYIDRDQKEGFHSMKCYPSHLNKKKTLLEYFTNYMNEHLLKAGGNVDLPKGIETARLPFLRTWLRTRSAIVLHLSCGILQVNFFHDHTKIFVCPKMGAVTYIDEKKQFRTFKFSSIEQFGCSTEVVKRLKYARTMIEKMQSSKTTSCPPVAK